MRMSERVCEDVGERVRRRDRGMRESIYAAIQLSDVGLREGV